MIRSLPPRKDAPKPMSNALKMVGLIEDQLKWAERNRHWDYMEALLNLLKVMGAQVLVADGGFMIQFDVSTPTS